MLRIGETILKCRYEVDDLIYQGGQASVARAIDRQTGRTVAIRRLTATPEQPHFDLELHRFQRAATLRLDHPNIVDPIEYAEEGGASYTILPFVEGCSLEVHISRSGGRLPADRAVGIMAPVASALGACHERGVIHRDIIKPTNIMVDPDERPHLIDFGICGLTHEPTLTRGDGFLASLPWAAPEQVMSPGTRDPRQDLYSLGATFYYALTGKTPTRGDTPKEIMLSICNWVPPPPGQLVPGIPSRIDDLCMRLLAKRPDERYQTAEAVLQDLAPGQAVSISRYCPSCGRGVQSKARFCTACGATLNAGPSIVVRCIACGEEADHPGACLGCGRSFGSTDHRLTFTAGPLSGFSFRIPEGTHTVGRDELSPGTITSPGDISSWPA